MFSSAIYIYKTSQLSALGLMRAQDGYDRVRTAFSEKTGVQDFQ